VNGVIIIRKDGKANAPGGSLFSSLRGRQLLNYLALRPPIGPNALPLIVQLKKKQKCVEIVLFLSSPEM